MQNAQFVNSHDRSAPPVHARATPPVRTDRYHEHARNGAPDGVLERPLVFFSVDPARSDLPTSIGTSNSNFCHPVVASLPVPQPQRLFDRWLLATFSTSKCPCAPSHAMSYALTPALRCTKLAKM